MGIMTYSSMVIEVPRLIVLSPTCTYKIPVLQNMQFYRAIRFSDILEGIGFIIAIV